MPILKYNYILDNSNYGYLKKSKIQTCRKADLWTDISNDKKRRYSRLKCFFNRSLYCKTISFLIDYSILYLYKSDETLIVKIEGKRNALANMK